MKKQRKTTITEADMFLMLGRSKAARRHRRKCEQAIIIAGGRDFRDGDLVECSSSCVSAKPERTTPICVDGAVQYV